MTNVGWIIFGRHGFFGQGVEECGLTNVWQAHDADLKRHSLYDTDIRIYIRMIRIILMLGISFIVDEFVCLAKRGFNFAQNVLEWEYASELASARQKSTHP